MRLNTLLGEAGIPPVPTDAEVANVTDKIEGVVENSVFVCIRGSRTDGRRNAAAALRAGAAAVLGEDLPPAPAVIPVPDARLAYSRLCAAFRGRPDQKLSLVGITGTNGKTTTAAWLRHLLERCGLKTALIGTRGCAVEGEPEPTGYTTPPPDVFFSALARAAEGGCRVCAAEVSSQALAQKRVHGAAFRLGILTNIGRDHLDYHGTLARMVEAKTELCTLSDAMLLNADDAYAEDFRRRAKTVYLYSCRGRACDFSAARLRIGADAVAFDFRCGAGTYPVRVPAPGLYAAYNALAALSAAVLLGAPPGEAAAAAADLPGVPGRGEILYRDGVRVCIDFAHTQAALSAVLSALRPGTAGRLITVFGCGGDRDRTKRPYMGETAALLSDAVILTSDNPRHEDPLAILAEIRAGIRSRTPVFTEPDRKKAIRLALAKARPGDTVLIAGKGNENTQLVGDAAIPFSDRAVVTEG